MKAILDSVRDCASPPPETDRQESVQQADSALWRVIRRVLAARAQSFKDCRDKGYFEVSLDQVKGMSA
eukprot:2297154-Alexandrium_andersonii.AAC.1